MDQRSSANVHVSSDCDPRTKAALTELVHAAARQHGYDGEIDVNFTVRDEDGRLAEYLADTEAFDA